MRSHHLQQAEVFAFLAALFLVGVFLLDQERRENPPIVILSEREQQYRFGFGSAEVPSAFALELRTRIIPQLDSLSRACRCNVLEVVGHTDDVRVRHTRSNLDEEGLRSYLRGDVSKLRAGSNTDLGMMRAMVVVQLLRESQARGMLREVEFFLPFSAGQMIGLDGRPPEFRDDEAEESARRRIEIRLRRAN